MTLTELIEDLRELEADGHGDKVVFYYDDYARNIELVRPKEISVFVGIDPAGETLYRKEEVIALS